MPGISTKAIHGADHLSRVSDVVQPINVSTTFKYSENPQKLVKYSDIGDQDVFSLHHYSRFSHPNSSAVEAAVGDITDSYAVSYASGLSAFHGALTYFNPKILAIGKGYHGCHGIADILTRNYGLKQIGLDDDFSQLSKGDVVHLETPINPDGTNFNIKYYADKAHEKGAYLMVDATFAPPPLQDPFKFGADIVMHSATKYFGGHSDLLAGLLLTKSKEVRDKLLEDRALIGTNISNLESYLLLRSIRTLELRVLKQSENATKLVKYLQDHIDDFDDLVKISHGSLQSDEYIKEQMPIGHSPCFCILLKDEATAKAFPSKLKYFHHATSLGGVESLIEWRVMSDSTVSPKLLRISVGVENVEDLIDDLHQALST
jgi:cystathionine gamma-synthase